MYTKNDFVKDFEKGNIKLVFIGQGRYRGINGSWNYNRYMVYAGDLHLTHYNTDFMAGMPYYNKRTKALAVSCIGMSQDFEARAKLTDLAMYSKKGEYDHDYFYAHVDKDIKVLGY